MQVSSSTHTLVNSCSPKRDDRMQVRFGRPSSEKVSAPKNKTKQSKAMTRLGFFFQRLAE